MISIIIVGFNSKKYLSKCFKSILSSDLKTFRIIFVDNNSSDGSVEYVKKYFPNVLVLESRTNLGFAAGNNLGIKKALHLKSDFVFILNPDTIIDKSCLKRLKMNATENIVQPLILLIEDNKKTNLINTTGSYLNFLGISYCDDYRKHANNIVEKDITTASGAASFIPATVFKKVGFFDENLFMYHEDVDLFWRARLAGYNIRLVPEAKVWHDYKFSKGKNKFFFIERNRLIFIFKNFSLKYLLLISPMMIINELLMIAYSVMGGWFPQKIKSYFSFIRLIPQELKNRKKIKKIISSPERQLKKFLMPSISFSEISNPFLSSYNRILKVYWSLIIKII